MAKPLNDKLYGWLHIHRDVALGKILCVVTHNGTDIAFTCADHIKPYVMFDMARRYKDQLITAEQVAKILSS